MDTLSILFSVVLLAEGLLFRLIDHLQEIRRLNASEAAVIRVLMGCAYPQRQPENMLRKLRLRRRQILGSR